MKLLLHILKWLGILILSAAVLLFLLLVRLAKKPFVPADYTRTVRTGGALEAKYLAMGPFETARTEADAPEDWGKFIVHYPVWTEPGSKACPVVVMVNGTGVYASKYPALFEHLASWGFLVVGNEDPSTCTGDSADAALAYLLQQNEDPNSPLYGRADPERIGITGHSQGGVGVFNAVNEQPNGHRYTCAVSLSPTEWAVAEALGMHYDPYQTTVPTLILAAAENDVITPEGAKGLLEAVNAPAALALRRNTDHGQMLYCADGYVTAWLMWHLQDDPEARSAFVGENAEFLANETYCGQTVLPDCE